MRNLPDTQVFIWVVPASTKLGGAARDRLRAADAVFVSAASTGEIAIKRPLGKVACDPRQMVETVIPSGFQP